MEIEIKNFGPIDYLKFDLDKDLHLIYGQNAIGKSYATYCLYCLLKNIKGKSISITGRLVEGDKDLIGSSIKEQVKNLNIDESIDFTEKILILVENELKDIFLNSLKNSFLNTFSSLDNLKNRYSNKNFEISIWFSKSEKLVVRIDETEKLELRYNGYSRKVEIVNTSDGFGKYALFVGGMQEGYSDSIEGFSVPLARYLNKFINRILYNLNSNIRDIYYLPASRSGLYQALNAFTPILAELTQNRFFMQNKSIELPSLSEPVADYFIDLSTVNKNHVNKEFDEIIGILQNDILKGEVEYDDQTKKIMYKPTGINLDLGLSEASSMVAELSPLVLYLKHILNNKYGSNTSFYGYESTEQFELAEKIKDGYDILFIEEPEAHLHPEVQVKLMEVFAKLSELGLKVFITSHSNYMFNKLNNLLIKKEVNKDKVQVYHLVKTPLGSAVNAGMSVSEDGIEDDNFQETSEKLYYERLDYLENNDTGN
jgi:predicted ATP-dependent endonuclease of OLD family